MTPLPPAPEPVALDRPPRGWRRFTPLAAWGFLGAVTAYVLTFDPAGVGDPTGPCVFHELFGSSDHRNRSGIHGAGGDGSVDTPVESASAGDEVTEGGEEGVTLLGCHELMASNDDHFSPKDRYLVTTGWTALGGRSSSRPPWS